MSGLTYKQICYICISKRTEMRRILYITTTILLACTACSNRSKLYPGFNQTSTGVHYKLISLGDGASKAAPSDYITINIAYRTPSDSLFFSGTRLIHTTEPHYKGSIDECFFMLMKGDSAAFYIKAQPFFEKTIESKLPKFLDSTGYIRIDMLMIDIQNEEQFNLEKEAFLSWVEDFGEYEKIIIKQYLDGEKISIKPTESGLYIIPQVITQNSPIEIGDTITVHFEGRFLNGKIFDSTRKRNEPFIFVYGEKWQVIPGIEEALGKMREGEKSMLIIPSYLAFGKEGNSSGVIPAFTSAVFEVEVVEVKKGQKK